MEERKPTVARTSDDAIVDMHHGSVFLRNERCIILTVPKELSEEEWRELGGQAIVEAMKKPDRF